MDKKFIIALMVAFIAMKNPVINLAEVDKAYAEPQVTEKAAALSEANIAVNIESLYRTQILTTDEKAKIQIESYQKQIEEESEVKEQAALKDNASKITSLTSAGLSANFVQTYVEAAKAYNVPWQVLAAIHYVESHQAGSTAVTSYAGAEGPMQFMPSTFYAFGQDADGDGRPSITSVYDAIFTAANYIAANGAANNNVVGALYRYNHDSGYVYQVLSIARSIGYSK